MSLIDDWTPLFPKSDDAAPARAARGQARAPADTLQSLIYKRLSAMQPAPIAVHYYLGEGLRWIRVGFNGQAPLTPAAALAVAGAIEECLDGEALPLYFQALRSHDLLFFLEGGDADSEGLPPSFYGVPLEQVRRAWGGAASPARQARTGASASSRAAAPHSQRRRSKP